MNSIKTLWVSTHLITNAWVIEPFGLASVAIDPSTQVVTATPSP
ncbi:MAG: hypothetical protein SFY66_26390 [Oculatellaceae cyanobacterium bins.114]|nr:hypothetical protein [Oculatellaceae cyanobacterium bins.114]